MLNKMFIAGGVLLLAISSVKAETLSINAVHQQANDVEAYLFENTSAGDVTIIMDTLTNGFDASLVVWKKKDTPSASNQPNDSGWGGASQTLNSDWALVRRVYNSPRPSENSSQNSFGISVKNGFDANSLFPTGTPDPGVTLSGLAAGVYLITVNGTINDTFADNAGDSIASGNHGSEQFSNNSYPHNYTLNISGSHVAEFTSTVEPEKIPLPGIVLWMFGAILIALVSLGKRFNSNASEHRVYLSH